MLLRVELSQSGLGKLTAFCAARIREDLDPAETAFQLMQTGDFGTDDPVRIAIGADLTRDGQGAEIVFSEKDDFCWHDLDGAMDIMP